MRDGHDGGAGDGNLGDVAPALHEHQTVDVADDTQDQTDEQADVHGFTEEADLLLDGAGIDADLVETELGKQHVEDQVHRGVTVVVRGGHDATGVVVIGRPALLHGLSDEQSYEVDEQHERECQGHIAAQKEQQGAPHRDGVIVPQVRRHEDVGDAQEPYGDLEEQTDADEHHAQVRGVAHGRNGLPSDVERRLGNAGHVNHALDERGQDATERRGHEGHAHEADADEYGGLEGAFGGRAEDLADDEDDDGNGDIVAEGIKELL